LEKEQDRAVEDREAEAGAAVDAAPAVVREAAGAAWAATERGPVLEAAASARIAGQSRLTLPVNPAPR
jgi:hypothetical protein